MYIMFDDISKEFIDKLNKVTEVKHEENIIISKTEK